MSRLLGALALSLTLSVSAASCGCAPTGPSCDQAALLAVTEALEHEVSAPGSELRAIRGIAAACPGLRPGHGSTFHFRYDPTFGTDEATHHIPLQTWSEEFAAENWAACANPRAYGLAPFRAYRERGPLFYEACGVARFGVLDEGERFVDGDKDSFFLLAALDRKGVDMALLRRLGRALMNSTASLPTALRRCNSSETPDQDACQHLLDLNGIDPGSVRGSTCSWDGDLRLFITPRAVLWDNEVVARIDRGAIAPEDLAHHRIYSLTPLVEAWANNPPVYSNSQTDYEPASRLLIAADQAVPMGVLHEVLQTATRAGVKDLALVAGVDEVLPVVRPSRETWGWTPEPIVLDQRGLRATLPGKEALASPLDSPGGLESLIDRLREHYSRDDFLVRVAPTIRVRDALPVLAMLSVRGCSRRRGSGEFPHIVLDQEPPLTLRPGRWSEVKARIGSIELDPDAPESQAPAELRALLAPRLPPLSNCIREDEAMQIAMPEHLWIYYSRESGDVRASIIVDNDDLKALPRCVFQTLRLGSALEPIIRGETYVRLDLVYPVDDAPAP
ncbi:MAG: hypothetical protein R3B09_08855 [Nannocystaceae bacterium]